MTLRDAIRFGSGLVLLCAVLGALAAEDRRDAKVGMAARIEQIVLPGPELDVKPLGDRQSPVVLRISSVAPHGTAFRYDLVYYGLEPGTFDLKDYLRRKDGSGTADLPPLAVTIRSILPAGQVEPNRLELQGSPWLGGYRMALTIGGVLWGAGALAILFARRRKGRAVTVVARPLTVADRLKPLVEGAMSGRLSAGEQADLERTLLVYWRHRLDLDGLKPAEAFAVLRRHAEAGPLLEQLEIWLHRPGPRQPVDLSAILKPYRDMPAKVLP